MEQTVKIDDIIIDERMRKEYLNVESLAESMKAKGQLIPILLNKDLKLRAGGRRIAAAKLLKWDSIQARILDDNDELEDLDIEFIENFQRDDFKWQERCLGIQKLHKAHKVKDYKWSQRDTARILGIGKSTVNNQLQLAEALATIPGIDQAESEKDAWKKLNALIESIYSKELAGRTEAAAQEIPEAASATSAFTDEQRRVTKEETADLLTQLEQLKTEGITDDTGKKILPASPEYIVGDFFEAAKNMKDGYLGDYSLIECDPPYGIDLTEMKDSAPTQLDHYNEVPKENYPEWTRRLMVEFYRILGANSRVLYWFGSEWQHMILEAALEAGFTVNPIPAIWYKTNSSGQNKQPRVNLSNVYEPFFILRKGMPILGHFGRRNVFPFDMVPDKDKIHPTERPFDLMEEVLTTVANKTSVSQCLVPFLGSGKTLKVCQKLGIRAWGYDLSQEYRDRYVISK